MDSFALSIPFEKLIQNLRYWLENSEPSCFLVLLSGNQKNCPEPTFKKIVVGTSSNQLNCISNFNEIPSDFNGIPILGYLSYELKNEFEDLSSTGKKLNDFNNSFFFQPEFYFEVDKNDTVYTNNLNLFNEIIETEVSDFYPYSTSYIPFSSDVSDGEYLDNIQYIKDQITEGNVYELNYCRNFSAQSKIDPYHFFSLISKENPTPYSFFFKLKEDYLVSSSMERFLTKRKDVLTSQPIKGTIRNSQNTFLEETQTLLNSEKERAENLMIVDLVRNDLSKCSTTGSVSVDELFGVYSYPNVHQMISTVSSQVSPFTSFQEIIKSLFPMGSMTGAPKLSAMKIIDSIESFQRGVFSGSFGYIEPNGDFDFNVVIRTLFYNSKTHEINIPVGSAITIDSIAQDELNECSLKIELIKQLVSKCALP